MPLRFAAPFAGACLALAVAPASLPQSRPATNAAAAFPSKETLSYEVEWRLIYAGNALLASYPEPAGAGWEVKLHLESGGLVSKLYHLDDNYVLQMDDHFCASRTDLNAMERNRHRETKVEYDRAKGKASYVELELPKNTVVKSSEVDIPACVSDILGGLYKLRTMRLELGHSDQLPLSDGKKTVLARVEAQAREPVKTKAGTFNTVRYEAFIFNGALYARKAQFWIWLTDDARRVPVQIRARMGFPVGSITLQMVKEEH
jgi:hypothetical protein